MKNTRPNTPSAHIRMDSKLKDLDARAQEWTVQELLDMVTVSMDAAATKETNWLEQGFEPMDMPTDTTKP